MVTESEKRGARIMSAEFKWPRLRVHSEKLRKLIMRKKKKKKSRGLFVFPLQSRVTGASYSYQWMNMAQENGWHVLLDACALGPKDMDSLGLSLFQPDFLICSFYKVFGENPTGFGCLFVKKSTVPILEASSGAGIVCLVPAKQLVGLSEDSSGTDIELEGTTRLGTKDEEVDSSSSFSGPIDVHHGNSGIFRNGETSQMQERNMGASDKGEKGIALSSVSGRITGRSQNESLGIEFRCLDHVDSLGLKLTNSRARCLINWLVSAMMKLQHPNRLDNFPLVRIYGPKIKFDRGPALAFNVYDWKGERVEPVLIQKLADRNNISLGHGFLHNIWFSDKYVEEKDKVIERRKKDDKGTERRMNKRQSQGITVVTVALSFLANFEDVYRLWSFISQFLDADFVEKERWRYTALNQKTVEV